MIEIGALRDHLTGQLAEMSTKTGLWGRAREINAALWQLTSTLALIDECEEHLRETRLDRLATPAGRQDLAAPGVQAIAPSVSRPRRRA